MNKIDIQVHETKNFSKEEREKFLLAMEKATHALNSPEFTHRMVSLPLEQTNGHTKSQILQMLMSGADKFNVEKDKDIDVYITLYYSFRNTIGYTYPSTWFTWVNRKFFSSFNHASIGGHVVHEYMHNLGFGHDSPSDHNSVPYAVGYLVRDMISEYEAYGRYLEVSELPSYDDIVKKSQKRTVLGWVSHQWTNLKLLLKRLF